MIGSILFLFFFPAHRGQEAHNPSSSCDFPLQSWVKCSVTGDEGILAWSVWLVPIKIYLLFYFIRPHQLLYTHAVSLSWILLSIIPCMLSIERPAWLRRLIAHSAVWLLPPVIPWLYFEQLSRAGEGHVCWLMVVMLMEEAAACVCVCVRACACLDPNVPRISCGSTATLTRIKHLLKMKESMNEKSWLCFRKWTKVNLFIGFFGSWLSTVSPFLKLWW